MTSKKAIRVLEDNRPSVIFEDEDAQKRMTELCSAIDMAIEAVSREARLAKEVDRLEKEITEMEEMLDNSISLDDDDIEYMWREFAKENEDNLTAGAIDIKKALWAGYLYGKTPKQKLIKAMAEELTYEDIIKAEEYAKGYADGLKAQLADRPHGEWIERLAYNTDLDVDVPYIECDQCGHRPYFGGSYRPKYCEECGAKMDGNTDKPHGFTADEWYRENFNVEEME